MACGCEKKDDGKKCNDFTKAVINIENPETLTLFHKVVIPASMGDEETVPPAVGKYCNTLVYYEASGNSYLYSSDGIPTLVTGKDGKDGKDGVNGKDGKDGADGRDGAIQYTAGTGINISAGNVISATGSASVAWGDISGNITNQTDLNTALGGKQNTLTAGANITIDANNEISATDTTYTDFVGASSLADGAAGLVPKPLKSQRGRFLKGDGTWGTPTNTTYNDFVGTDGVSDGVHGLVPAPTAADVGTYLNADGTWATPPGTTYSAGTNIQITGTTISATDTTYSNFGGATTLVAGSAGLVPAPTTADPDKFLKGDGTWGTPTDTTYSAGTNIQINGTTISATDTTYSNFTGTDGVSAGTAGLVPAPATTDDGKYLKADGTWATVAGGGSNITMTNTDPGEGSPLAADNYVAVYGSSNEGGFSRYAVNQTFSSTTTLLADSTNTPDVGVSYSSGTITIQKAGWWAFTTSVGGVMNTEPSSLSVVISVNNVDAASSAGYAKSGYLTTRTVSWIGKMAVGDQVKVQVSPGASITLNNNDHKDRGTFTGTLIYAI